MPKTLPPVDDDVFAALQALAEPLIDDVNSVLRRLLCLDPAAERSPFPASNVTPLSSPSTSSRPAQPKQSASQRRKPTKAKRSAASGAKPRAPRGSLLPEAEYEMPLLRCLAVSGRAPASEVVEAVGQELGARFTPTDHETLASGEVRWKSRVQFVRLKLIREGAMVKDSPRGVWEITDLGRQRINGSAGNGSAS